MPMHPLGTPLFLQHDSKLVYDTISLSQHLAICWIHFLQLPVTGRFDRTIVIFSSWQNQEHSSGTPAFLQQSITGSTIEEIASVNNGKGCYNLYSNPYLVK